MRIVVGSLLLASALGCSREERTSPPTEKPAASPAVAKTPAAAAPTQPSAAAADPPPPVVPPTAGTLRLVVVSDAEPLTSEASQVNALLRHIEKAGTKVEAPPSTAEERSYLEQLVKSAETQPPLPLSWASFETVVVLRIEPPRSVGSQRITGGRSHLVVVHPPSLTPAVSSIYVEKGMPAGTSIDGARLGVWIANHLKFRKGSQ